MQKKLTISIDAQVYQGLYSEIGARKISKFIEKLVRPYVLKQNLEDGYESMAKDQEREKTALEWSEALIAESQP